MLQELHDFAVKDCVELWERIRVTEPNHADTKALLQNPNIAQPLLERIGRLQFEHGYFINRGELDIAQLTNALLGLSRALDQAYKAKDWQPEAWHEKGQAVLGAGRELFRAANWTESAIRGARARLLDA